MHLIAGLGNPGSEYRKTRHNIGFMVLRRWCRSLGVALTGRRFHARNTETKYRGKKIILLRPGTFMNRSGRSIEACADFHGLEPEQILVIHDDIDLPVGRIKVVKAGRSGGHRGVSSIIERLGTDAFPRVKIGIGRPRYGETIEAYVLSPFYEDEKEIVKKSIQLAVQACEWFVSKGVESAMNHINCRTISGKEVRS